ncbi:hypothetical protein QE412_000758 [Microbacterium trichothecenolyticum]|uniref:Uncharacterized protein n=1 Tax=Microbacterium trichothecenolyticum TaxID=69370 RepID=A0ABU0TR95_MICTR|nr:hypothetical protein [Microbacterium trichothecenolyticum]
MSARIRVRGRPPGVSVQELCAPQTQKARP